MSFGNMATSMSNVAGTFFHIKASTPEGRSTFTPANSRMAHRCMQTCNLRPGRGPTGDIAALGDGRQGTQTREFTTKPGDTVLYSKFGIGCTDVSVQVGGRRTQSAPRPESTRLPSWLLICDEAQSRPDTLERAADRIIASK